MADRYAVEREIGAGGMATVYLARDLRHDRKVALKVLHEDLGAVLGVERFLSEIRVTANLQHPNVLPLFDSGSADGLLFYVMPFVEGESLRHRLEREKQLPVEEAVRIGIAVAHALDYAHATGVIHRDLKPDNILLQRGQPFVADFGIALAISNAGGSRLTQSGLSLGTPQYMSPEQAGGERLIDARTDVYSLGAVVYEMLTGEPPHTGATAQAMIAKLMTEEVRPIVGLRRSVPRDVDSAVRRALEKLPADRFATAGAFAEALAAPRVAIGDGEATVFARGTGAPARRASFVRRAIPWTAALVGVGIAAWSLASGVARAPVVVQLSLPVDPPLTFETSRSMIAATPDGSRIVFTASRGGTMQAFVRSIQDETATPLPGTEDAAMLFVSADGKSVGVRSTDGEIKSVPIGGGAVRTIAKSSSLSTPAWSSKDLIVFSQGFGTGLSGVAASGGTPRPITTLGKEELGHGMPAFLPDGEAILFTLFRGRGPELAVTTLRGEVTRLGIDGVDPMFVQPDLLLYVRTNGDVEAIRFDPKSHRTIGGAIAVLQGVAIRGQQPLLTVSADGNLLAYVKRLPRARVGLLDSSGVLQLLRGDAGRYGNLRVSPNGDRIAIDLVASDGTQDIWIDDLKAGASNKLTSDGRSTSPVWSSDGKRIAFTRRDSAAGGFNVYTMAADGSDAPRPLVVGPGARNAGSFTPDGRTLVYQALVQGRSMHIAAVGEDGRTRVLAESPGAAVGQPVLSPDGRWLAYVSNETRRDEVFVGPMSGAWKKQVSTLGGASPAWSRDGRTLYYREDSHIVAVAIEGSPESASGNGTITVGARRRFASQYLGIQNVIAFDPMPDGKHLAVLVPTDEGADVTVVVNWMERVTQLMRKQ
ncbi:MAG: protein kinase [Gemmatimonadaceae bacterium]